MLNLLLILLGKFIIWFSRLSNQGNGSTWPGHIALSVHKTFLKDVLRSNTNVKIVFIIGTNGKTTTGKMITTILEKSGKRVFQNTSGANLLNGIASSFIHHANLLGKINEEFAIFEVDENTLPLAIEQITPFAVIALNLFRDQLDRYGELDTIAKKWKKALEDLPQSSFVILNGDDPQIAYLGSQKSKVKGQKERNIHFFGLPPSEMKQTELQHGADSIYCPNCHSRLAYSAISFSHVGSWKCLHCGLKRPSPEIKNIRSPLPGIYNEYNTAAALTFANAIGIDQIIGENNLKDLTPAFGRQEKVAFNGKYVQLFLAKNPTSFNQSIRTVVEMGGKHVLFVLHDRIPDGRDVSWIWDIDIESYVDSFSSIIISGDRVYDMALRVQYSSNSKSNAHVQMFENLEEAIHCGVQKLEEDEILYILPTYSAMLEVRKILTGKKIL
jgi:UDP-N-acetylmuramyl tripeptide synthase